MIKKKDKKKKEERKNSGGRKAQGRDFFLKNKNDRDRDGAEASSRASQDQHPLVDRKEER